MIIPTNLTPHIQTAIRIHADEMARVAATRQQMIDEGVSFLFGAAQERELQSIAYLQSTAAALLDYANSFSVEVQIEPSRKVHNPDGLTPEQVGVGEGWRLLDEDEINPKAIYIKGAISCLLNNEDWGTSDYAGTDTWHTYRTKLTRKELKQKRGLV